MREKWWNKRMFYNIDSNFWTAEIEQKTSLPHLTQTYEFLSVQLEDKISSNQEHVSWTGMVLQVHQVL